MFLWWSWWIFNLNCGFCGENGEFVLKIWKSSFLIFMQFSHKTSQPKCDIIGTQHDKIQNLWFLIISIECICLCLITHQAWTRSKHKNSLLFFTIQDKNRNQKIFPLIFNFQNFIWLTCDLIFSEWLFSAFWLDIYGCW